MMLRTALWRHCRRLCTTSLVSTQGAVIEFSQPDAAPCGTPHLRSLGLTDAECTTLLQRFPNLQRVTFQQPLSSKLAFLSEKGMNREGMVRFFADVLQSYPEFLDLDLDVDVRPVFVFLTGLGLSDEEVLVMLIQYPHLVGFDVDDVLAKKVAFLEEMEFDRPQVSTMLLSFPQYFGVSLERNIRPVVTYLTQEMDLGKSDLHKIFVKCPHLFGVRLDATRAKLDFLIQSGFEMKTIRALTKRFPAYLRSSLQEKIRPTLEILLEYAPIESVKEIFYKCPQCLCLSYDEEILPKFRFFAELGYDEVDLRIMIEKFPEVLCYSLEDEIMPTVERAIEAGLTLLEARLTFAREPELFRHTIAKVMKDKEQNRSTPQYLVPLTADPSTLPSQS